ncbi:hypothetical protein [Pseudomonas bohemica]|uniref:hypothetical protein n=1 Tax=Pseudomonas bohemica TaxID=2044872 RepID=UPI000DA634F4|nr:hypothetical protein [Pseudomonas bohemica]
MSDQIMLCNAAKSAGIGPVLCYESSRNCLRIGARDSYTRWRPLTHSDDALALAVANPAIDLKFVIQEAWQAHDDQPSRLAYVRRKIVHVAAEVGRTMS